MKDQLVSFKVAQLAKEKGFACDCLNYWGINTEMNLEPELQASFSRHASNYNHDINKGQAISAPTQSLLQRWLRDAHDIIITISFGFTYNIYDKQWNRLAEVSHCKSYEEALEKGLEEALKLI
jgi:hypothetical protein